tara:strand:- start:1348 stop:1560 length:213 start_codon:yes stop_codon:yes gene_type:complete
MTISLSFNRLSTNFLFFKSVFIYLILLFDKLGFVLKYVPVILNLFFLEKYSTIFLPIKPVAPKIKIFFYS